MTNEQEPHNDPLELEAVDRDIRINELSERVNELGMSSLHVNDDCPADVHEQFLGNVVDFESLPVASQFERLVDAGAALPPPASLDDAALHAKLWEVIKLLASRSTFLYHTNHLSDRQLYEHLWTDTLREETTVTPPGSGWRCHIDLIGSGSEEDIEIGLRYYDTEEQRQHWATEFPNDVIPPHEDPPFDRDRLLPAADPELAEPDGEEGE